MFDLRHISFFRNGNEFTGSADGLRYRIVPEDEVFHVWTWYTDVCFEKADPGEPTDFPLTDEGLDALKKHLEERYETRP